ncbi:MAG TPA: class I SAM-dependent methyltransferase [Steroidobacteraceae bacterium]|jgi:SAM-dependent methyltransferase
MTQQATHRFIKLLNQTGRELAPGACILDLGCGAGEAVYAFVEHGFPNTCGFDIKDYLHLRAPEDRHRFRIGLDNGRLPFDSNSFDLVFSEEVFEHVQDQVPMWRELHRIMKPGGISVHTFPAPYCLIEPHNYVPLGGVITQYWWYNLWALLGIRNEFQRKEGTNATQTARWNTFRIIENLNYVNNSCYRVIWEELGFEWKWLTQESFDLHPRGLIRWAGRLNRLIPIVAWSFRAFVSRKVLLQKPSSPRFTRFTEPPP